MTPATPSFWTALRAALSTAEGPVITFSDRYYDGPGLLAAAEQWAGVLAARGVMAGDRVAAQCAKSIDLVLLYLATLRLGAVYLPLNTGYTDVETGYFVGDAEPAMLVRDHGGVVIERVTSTAIVDLARAAATESCLAPPHTVTSVDLAAIVYTSGTTGRSKGAMITHGNLLANARALIEIWSIDADDRLLHALPLFHIHGLFVALNTLLLAGGRVDMVSAFETATVLERLPDATVFMGVPTYYSRLLADPIFDATKARGVRVFVSGSAPLTIQTFEQFETRTGKRILERYGMSECGIIASNPLEGERIAGAVGQLLPGFTARIADGAVVGVLEVQGPSVFAGYWRMPEKTRSEFRDDGYFITGDVATIGEEGVIRIVGRDKDMIISGGLNIYPKEIEERLDALPGVGEAAIIGVPHPDFGEAVVAVVTANAGVTLDPDAIVAQLRGNVAGFKLPKAVCVVPELPRNAMGKVQKAQLRKRYTHLFAPAMDADR